MGTHANSEVVLNLNGGYDRFRSDVGVDDEEGFNGSVAFQVWADGTKLYDSGLNGVEFVGMKLGFVNLRASTITDVVFRDCVIDEIDVADARLLRVSFEGSTIREVAGTNTRVEHVDLRGAVLDRVERLEGLRGATIGGEQLYALAPLLAAQAGYRVA